MYNFFVTAPADGESVYKICGSDYNHVKNVLRLGVGDTILVSFSGSSDLCEIVEFSDCEVIVKIVQKDYQDTSLPIGIHLFQGLPKSDKLELIIQKAVELGAESITPVETSRSIVKIEEKKKKSKLERWQAIAESAAKQSKRTLIPEVKQVLSFKAAVETLKNFDLILIPYENHKGMISTAKALKEIKGGMNVAVFIGPEGGFSEDEVAAVIKVGGKSISLGKRILRTETAAVTAIAMLMLHSELNF